MGRANATQLLSKAQSDEKIINSLSDVISLLSQFTGRNIRRRNKASGSLVDLIEMFQK